MYSWKKRDKRRRLLKIQETAAEDNSLECKSRGTEAGRKKIVIAKSISSKNLRIRHDARGQKALV